MNMGSKRIVILNVYMLYECLDNEPEFINRIATIVDYLDTTCVYTVFLRISIPFQ